VPLDVAYGVAKDVASYSQFLPLLSRSVIRGRRNSTSKGERFDAELAVVYPKLGLSGSFVSQVETDDTAHTVEARSQDGPFRSLKARWTIRNAPAGSEVEILIEYAFRNPLLQLAAAGVMDMAVSKVMAAFEARALITAAPEKANFKPLPSDKP
jgi:coenzyme Q-binding protein COQ10